MGHRANFVIIRSGEARAFEDQWAALGCTYGFAEGPSQATRAMELFRPTDELMDSAFAEAGYLIDHDEKVAIVFGYPEFDPDALGFEDEPPQEAENWIAIDKALMKGPEHFLELIAPLWRGWEIIWDSRGVDAFADYFENRSIESIATQPPEDIGDRELFRLRA